MACQPKEPAETTTFVTACNPMNLSYRFCLDLPSRREAADPTVVWFKDRYFLFASKSGGYWHSKDLTNWTFVETSEIPTEEYAPTALGIGDTLYFLASSNEKSTVYKTADPLSGKWSVAREELETPVWDPTFFMDDDNRLYLYWGCSNENPIHGVEMNASDFSFVGKPVDLLYAKPSQFGWEVPGDYNTSTEKNPWIEGAWMNKHNGTYYLQYSGPGTEFKSYSDGVYTSQSPLGPFTYQPHNPFAYKPEGFAAGAGHGSTFADPHGNFWHIGTMTISVKHMFERRLGMFPAFFDEQGTLYTATQYGDYPYIIPTGKITNFEDLFPGWMLLSYNKQTEVSSSVDSLPASNITDEDIRTYWAAAGGGPDEYVSLDLGDSYDVYAIQINLAEHNTDLLGRQKDAFHRYVVEYSSEGTEWTTLLDKSLSEADNTHEYLQLPQKITCRYLRIKNVQVPSGSFAISGFRVFGKGKGALPDAVNDLTITRNEKGRRSVTLAWKKSENATGYNISYGTSPEKLYQHYMVYGTSSLTINSLDANQTYHFSVEAFNENGRTKGTTVVSAE